MSRRRRVRITLIGGLCLAVAAGVFLRASRGSGSSRKHANAAARKAAVARKAARKAAATVATVAEPKPAPAPAPRPPKMSPAPPVLSPEAARQARAEAIRRSIEELQAECRKAAGGDWDRWSAQLEPVRAELLGKIAALKPLHPEATGGFEARSAVLEGKGLFPLVEATPDHYLKYVIRPDTLEEPFRRGRSVIAGARWLRRKGIDVVFVTVPKMTEIYPEAFLDHCPPDRILAPDVRRILLELLEADIEVMDLLHDLQGERDSDAEPLYQPADPHWGPRAQAIAARRVAERLWRYDFVARAQAMPPTCEWSPGPYRKAGEGAAFTAMNPEQQRRAVAFQPRSQPTPKDGPGPLYADSPQVVCIGDSYNDGFIEHFARELNLPVRNLSGGGYTTQAFKEFLREPGILANARVVVWLVCYPNLETPWPMPRPILEAVGEEPSR